MRYTSHSLDILAPRPEDLETLCSRLPRVPGFEELAQGPVGTVSLPFEVLPAWPALDDALRIDLHSGDAQKWSVHGEDAAAWGFRNLTFRASPHIGPEKFARLAERLVSLATQTDMKREERVPASGWLLEADTLLRGSLRLVVTEEKWVVSVEQKKAYPSADSEFSDRLAEESAALLALAESYRNGCRVQIDDRGARDSRSTKRLVVELSAPVDAIGSPDLSALMTEVTLSLHGDLRVVDLGPSNLRISETSLGWYRIGQEAMNEVFTGPLWLRMWDCRRYGIRLVGSLAERGADFDLDLCRVRSEGQCYWEGGVTYRQRNNPHFYAPGGVTSEVLNREISLRAIRCSREDTQARFGELYEGFEVEFDT